MRFEKTLLIGLLILLSSIYFSMNGQPFIGMSIIWIYLLISIVSMIMTMIRHKKAMKEFSEGARLLYFFSILEKILTVKGKVQDKPNKTYKVRVKKYYGTLNADSVEPADKIYLSDTDLENFRDMLNEDSIEVQYDYSPGSKSLIIHLRHMNPDEI